MLRASLVAVALAVAPTSRGLPQTRVPVVRLVAREYAFTVPRQVGPGLIRIRLVNRGTLPHYARIVRLDSAKTLSDVLAWRRSGGSPPAWFIPVGGPAPVAPGDSAEAAAVVRPGRHVVLCTYPASGGKSVHLDSGMVRELVVADSTANDSASTPNAGVADLEADATIIVGEYGFSPLATLRPGRHQIRVTNAGVFPHQVLLVRLPNGVSDRAELSWFRDNYTAARPGTPSGGLLEVRPSETGWFAVSLKPGRYVLICGFADGSLRHFDKGMVRLVEVGGS
jgi:hypothetical protein